MTEPDAYHALTGDPPDAEAGGGLFKEHSAEYARNRLVVVGKLTDVRESRSGDAAGDLKAAESALKEMEATRRQMQVQIKLELSGSSGSRQAGEEKLKEWTRDTASLRTELENTRNEFSRKQLGFGGGGGAGGHAERSAAKQSTEVLDQGLRRLQDAEREALEIEELGQGIMSDLASQRETILHARGNMGTIGFELSAARRSLDQLLSRASQNKMVTSGVFAMLAVGFMVYVLGFMGLDLKHTVLAAVVFCVALVLFCFLRRKFAASARDVGG